MNQAANQPEGPGSPSIPLGFPFVVIAAWLCAAAVVVLAREASLVDSLVWQHDHDRYDSGTLWFIGVRSLGICACALGIVPLGIWLGRATMPRASRRRWVQAGAVALLVASLFPVVRTAALVSDADRIIHRPPDLRLARLAPYATENLLLIGGYAVFLLVPGGLGYAVGWAVRTRPQARPGERSS